jgi:hypothetical protein
MVELAGAEAVALGRRLVASIEAAMMLTDPVRGSFELLVLRGEREEALDLQKRTERRARALRRAGAGTYMHANWSRVGMAAAWHGG